MNYTSPGCDLPGVKTDLIPPPNPTGLFQPQFLTSCNYSKFYTKQWNQDGNSYLRMLTSVSFWIRTILYCKTLPFCRVLIMKHNKFIYYLLGKTPIKTCILVSFINHLCLNTNTSTCIFSAIKFFFFKVASYVQSLLFLQTATQSDLQGQNRLDTSNPLPNLTLLHCSSFEQTIGN